VSVRLSLTDAEVDAMAAEEVLRWASEEWSEKLCLTCSWQKQSSVLVHMASELELDVDVIELDTHLFFKESYETRERLVERYGLSLVVPDVVGVAEQHRREGPNLWERDPDRCCHIRKVEPLIRALEPYEAWVSGIRRDQSPSRAGARKLDRSERYGVWKVQPLADWSEDDVWRYIVGNDIPYNPLHDVGYRSIGCVPCTRPTRPDEEERAGRWAGSDKLECGIHPEAERST
jgi:phosphoadenosine phosphosulfate reductase